MTSDSPCTPFSTSGARSRALSRCGALSLLGGSLLVGLFAESAGAGDYRSQGNACAAYGPDYAMVEGSGACVRIGGHVRVQLGTNAGLNPNNGWSSGSASAATLRSDGQGSAPTHLRVRGGLEYPDPFH